MAFCALNFTTVHSGGSQKGGAAYFISTCASSAHTLVDSACTHPIGGNQGPFPNECCCVFQISPLHCSLKRVVNLEWPLPSLFFFPPVAHQGVSQLGMSTSFSKIYPCVAHKRVSQVEMATSFSKLYPRVAHQRVSQLGRATFFSKFPPCMAHKRVSQVEMANFTPASPTTG